MIGFKKPHAQVHERDNALSRADAGLYPGPGPTLSQGTDPWEKPRSRSRSAASGTDVIFFILETPEIELIAKSISRCALKDLLESGEVALGQKPASTGQTEKSD